MLDHGSVADEVDDQSLQKKGMSPPEAPFPSVFQLFRNCNPRRVSSMACPSERRSQ